MPSRRIFTFLFLKHISNKVRLKMWKFYAAGVIYQTMFQGWNAFACLMKSRCELIVISFTHRELTAFEKDMKQVIKTFFCLLL